MTETVAQHGPLKAHAVRVDRTIAVLAEQHEAFVVRPAAERLVGAALGPVGDGGLQYPPWHGSL